MNQKDRFIESTNIEPATNHAVDPLKIISFILIPEQIKLDSIYPFLSFSAAWYETNGDEDHSSLSIRFSKNGTAWDDWIALKKDNHYERARYTAVSELMFANKDYRYYQLKVTSNLNFDGLNVHSILLNFFSPGALNKLCGKPFSPQLQNRSQKACSCMQPPYVPRTIWNCLQGPWNISPTVVSHIIIHHSAGPNESEDWASTVLSIWNFHTLVNEYADIGYHWLIAPDGTIFEGRYSNGTDVLGAHFCNKNSNTLGICMLGTFKDQSITPKARISLTRLLAWKSCNLNIDPAAILLHPSSGLDLNTISGHRQGCSTECPGEKLFSELGSLRNEVKSTINSACQTTRLKNENPYIQLVCSPNPSQDKITISGSSAQPGHIQYDILTMDGRLLYRSSVRQINGPFSEQASAWSSLSSGFYDLSIHFNGYTLHKKIIKN